MGMTMVEATLVEWLIPDGVDVVVGQPVMVVQTDKLDVDLEVEVEGTLRHAVPAGATVEAGAVVAWVLDQGEVVPPASERTSDRPSSATAAPTDHVAVAVPATQAASIKPGDPPRQAASPRARRLAREQAVEDGSRGPEVVAPPSVTFMAAVVADRLGLDLATIRGSGPGGQVTRRDVETAAAHAVRTAAISSGGAPLPDGEDTVIRPGPGDKVPRSGMRRVIGDRMHASLQDMAQLTLTMEVAADRMEDLRGQLRGLGAKVSFTDLVVKATALSLREHPGLNAVVRDDAIELLHEINVGVAVAVEGGLLVPVVRGADTLNLADLGLQLARLADACRSRKIAATDLDGATFTVSSLGMEGIDVFTPIVNPPNVAILGVGGIRDGVRWEAGRAVPSRTMALSLTVDHRAVDGVPAARFLATVRDHLETPIHLLLD